MSEHEKDSDKKYRCWISDEEKILSFSFEEGYELMEFDSYTEFQDYYYRKTYWGYRVQYIKTDSEYRCRFLIFQ